MIEPTSTPLERSGRKGESLRCPIDPAEADSASRAGGALDLFTDASGGFASARRRYPAKLCRWSGGGSSTEILHLQKGSKASQSWSSYLDVFTANGSPARRRPWPQLARCRSPSTGSDGGMTARAEGALYTATNRRHVGGDPPWYARLRKVVSTPKPPAADKLLHRH